MPAALHRRHDAGYRIVVTTNQSGIARGYLRERDLARIHARLHAALDRLPLAYLHCPHHPSPEGGDPGFRRACPCRKPQPGLLHQARELLGPFGVSLQEGCVIGDSARDLLMAADLPLQKVLVRSGKPIDAQRRQLADAGCVPDHEAADLPTAVAWLLG